jgi:hypothetical protein
MNVVWYTSCRIIQSKGNFSFFFSCFLLPYIVLINVLSSLLECANDFSNFLKEK